VGLKAVPARLSGQTMSVDLASAKEVNISPVGEADTVQCTLVIRQRDKEIYRQTLETLTASLEYFTTRTASIRMKRIPAGSFLMGSHDADGEARSDEKPQHSVRISKPFYLGVCEVTQGQFKEVMGQNPSSWSAEGFGKDVVRGLDTDRHPVE